MSRKQCLWISSKMVVSIYHIRERRHWWCECGGRLVIVKSVHLHRCYQYDQRGAYVLLETKAYVTLTERNGSSV